MKMRAKILLLCLGSTLFALVLQMLLFQNASSDLIYNQSKEESFNSLQNMQNEIFTFIKSIESNLIETYNDKELIRDLKDKQSTETLRTDYYRTAYNYATENFETSDSVLALYLYTAEHEIISTYRRAVTPKHNYPTDIYIDETMYNATRVREYVESDNTTMLISSYYNVNRETDIVRFVLKIYDNANINSVVGYVVCDVDSKVLRTIMKKYCTQEEMFMWLQPLGDRQILSVGNLEDANRSYYKANIVRIETGASDEDGTLSEDKRVLFQVPQNKYNLDAYSIMSQSFLKQNQRALTRSLILIVCIMSVAISLLSVLMAKGITKPLEQLTVTIGQIRAGNTKLRVRDLAQDEIGRLGHDFNEMLDEIERLIGHEYETKLLLNKAEYKALQAQINPHFLYNTLDTMSSIASVQNCPTVSNLCQSLSNIFRYSLDVKHPYSTVAKEIVHLKNYVYVMNVRMREDVIYEFDINEKILQDSIPRISIQPLVENALNHGLRNKHGDKKIIVCAEEADGMLQIIVEDNGVGMDADTMNRKLQEADQSAAEGGSSIGLVNINARMKMLYGADFGLHIESKEMQGTRVILRIPHVRVEEVDTWLK